MKESTLVANHSAAPSVARNLVKQVIQGLMKEFTMGVNHTVAKNVKIFTHLTVR